MKIKTKNGLTQDQLKGLIGSYVVIAEGNKRGTSGWLESITPSFDGEAIEFNFDAGKWMLNEKIAKKTEIHKIYSSPTVNNLKQHNSSGNCFYSGIPLEDGGSLDLFHAKGWSGGSVCIGYEEGPLLSKNGKPWLTLDQVLVLRHALDKIIGTVSEKDLSEAKKKAFG